MKYSRIARVYAFKRISGEGGALWPVALFPRVRSRSDRFLHFCAVVAARGRRLKAVSAGNAPGENTTKRTQFCAGSSYPGGGRAKVVNKTANGARSERFWFFPRNEHTGCPAPPSVESSLRVAAGGENETNRLSVKNRNKTSVRERNRRRWSYALYRGVTVPTATSVRPSIFPSRGFLRVFPISVCPVLCTRIRTFWKREHFSYSWKKFVFCLRPPPPLDPVNIKWKYDCGDRAAAIDDHATRSESKRHKTHETGRPAV